MAALGGVGVGGDGGTGRRASMSLLSALKTGWLSKQGHFIKSWKRRFCVLRPDCLIYYSDEQSIDVKGVVHFDQHCTISKTTAKKKGPALRLDGRGRSLVITTDDDEAFDGWHVAIAAEIRKHQPLAFEGFHRVGDPGGERVDVLEARVGSEIAPIKAKVTGGLPVLFRAHLVDGLVIDAEGVISGTPATAVRHMNVTTSATNYWGTATVPLALTCVEERPKLESYSANPAIYVLHQPVPPNVPSVSGGAPHKYALHKNSPPLPEGLELDEASGVLHGRPVGSVVGGDVVVAIKIVASNSGGESSLSITIQITPLHELAEAAEGSNGQGGGEVGVAGAAGEEDEEDEEEGDGVQELPSESRLLLKEGSLTKRATTGKNSWKVRHIQIWTSHVAYMKKPGETGDDLGRVALDAASTFSSHALGEVTKGGAAKRDFLFTVNGANEATLMLQATSEAEKLEWLEALNLACSYWRRVKLIGYAPESHLRLPVGRPMPESTPLLGQAGGTPLGYRITSGQLLPGMALDEATGVLSGTPIEDSAGWRTLTVAAYNHAGQVGVDMQVCAKGEVTPPSMRFTSLVRLDSPALRSGVMAAEEAKSALADGDGDGERDGDGDGWDAGQALGYYELIATLGDRIDVPVTVDSTGGGKLIFWGLHCPDGVGVDAHTGKLFGAPRLPCDVNILLFCSNSAGVVRLVLRLVVESRSRSVSSSASSVATSNRVHAAVSSASTTSTGQTTDEEARTLSEVRRCGLGIEQAGWLVKVGSKNENWRRRWVVLHPGGLRYYASDSPTATPKGEVVFDALSTIEPNPANASAGGGKVSAKPHMFAIVVRGRRLVLAPAPEAGPDASGVRETWLSSLARVLSFYKPPGTSSFASTVSTELTNEAPGSMTMADPYVFAYDTLRPSYCVGQPIKVLTPQIELASVLLFTAECLPPGLTTDPTTGVVSGTPTEPVAGMSCPVMATSLGGEATAWLHITVADHAPVLAGYSRKVVVFEANKSIKPVIPRLSPMGGSPVIFAVGGTVRLPEGLTLNPRSGIISGTPLESVLWGGDPYDRLECTIVASNTGGEAATPVTFMLLGGGGGILPMDILHGYFEMNMPPMVGNPRPFLRQETSSEHRGGSALSRAGSGGGRGSSNVLRHGILQQTSSKLLPQLLRQQTPTREFGGFDIDEDEIEHDIDEENSSEDEEDERESAAAEETKGRP